MATLTYWYCSAVSNNDCYSIIAKTKKEAHAKREEHGTKDYEAPIKKTLYYKDAFDLFDWVTSEGGGRGCGSTAKP
jgi:hypothetical protein